MAAFTVTGRTFETVNELEALVILCATSYDVNGYAEDGDGLEVSDPDYDQLLKELKVRKPKSKAFKGTSPSTAKPKSGTATIKHDPPMTSIAKADGTLDEKNAILEKWLDDCAARLGIARDKLPIAQSYKRDGVALRVNYVKGKLVSAALRPQDGINGTDVTRHMKYVKGVPQELALPLTLSLNGEIECWNADFEKINQEQDAAGEDLYKNPRNYTAGRMGRDDPEENKNARLRIAFYSITGLDGYEQFYKTEVERAKWGNSANGLNLNNHYIQIQPYKYEQLAILERLSKPIPKAPNLPYYVDGVVLKVDFLEYQEELGHVGDDPIGDPRYALAWKFEEEEAKATNDHLEWNASRTGRVVPTAIFASPVRLADTDVSRATANNYGWALKMVIGPGTIMTVKKAGKIIPKVVGIDPATAVTNIQAPSNCPTCQSKLVIHTSNLGNMDLLCNNPDCGAKQIHSWLFFLNKLDSKGLGASTMEKILLTGKVKTLPDLFRLHLGDLTKVLSYRQALLALATIWHCDASQEDDKLFEQISVYSTTKFDVDAWKFYASLGIPGAGETVGKSLMAHYKDFNKIRKASQEELTKVPGIGKITAKSIFEYFEKHKAMVDDLLTFFNLQLPKSGKLDGVNFVLTGSFTEGKDYWKAKIMEAGGNVQSGVGKTTQFLIQQHGKNDGSPSEKEIKAATLGVEVKSVEELEKML